MSAWNKGQKRQFVIATPQDLVPNSVELSDLDDFSAWDSEDDDDLNIPEISKKRKRSEITLARSDGKKIPKVPVFNLGDAIRLGRQIVKRNEYKYLPFVVQIGPTFFEYKDPGTLDIYATPLKLDQDGTSYRREGTSQDFNYKNLVDKLEKEFTSEGENVEDELKEYEPQRKKRKLDNIFDTFYGKEAKITVQEAETIGAISCDFMKGSSTIEFVKEAKEKVGESVSKFSDVFLGISPFYQPAKTKGRGEVTKRTRDRRRKRRNLYELEVNFLIEQNNCLINAIAQNHLGRNANLGELILIRRRLGNVGEMLAAGPQTIAVINMALRVQQDIVIHYNINDGIPNETIGEYGGDPIHIYHTGGLHFEAKCPNQNNYYWD